MQKLASLKKEQRTEPSPAQSNNFSSPFLSVSKIESPLHKTSPVKGKPALKRSNTNFSMLPIAMKQPNSKNGESSPSSASAQNSTS